jgi:REP element-mobilizing transposase RayT
MLSGGENFDAYNRHLPHWRAEHVIYFVTWRLHPTNAPLEPEERSIVANAIEFFHNSRYWLVAYVVMDDHVHILVRLASETQLESTVHTWKSYTARQLQHTRVRESRVWQGEYFDRIVRDADELDLKIQYIATNPQKRWPASSEYKWLKIYEAI